jgi:hypothetical protein
VLPCNTYNMDEKGFLIGILGRSKRVFSKQQWEKKEVKAALQDGSREWITVLASVCADGTAIPPGLIYVSANSSLQKTWVANITLGEPVAFTQVIEFMGIYLGMSGRPSFPSGLHLQPSSILDPNQSLTQGHLFTFNDSEDRPPMSRNHILDLKPPASNMSTSACDSKLS